MKTGEGGKHLVLCPFSSVSFGFKRDLMGGLGFFILLYFFSFQCVISNTKGFLVFFNL